MKDLAVPGTVIREALTKSGWEVEEVVKPDEWWCRERWHLRSVWSPQDCEAYLTFLADPMDEHPGKDHLNYREVWAVAASPQFRQRLGCGIGQFRRFIWKCLA